MDGALDELEAALGHRFAERELLVRALTHRSLAVEQSAAAAVLEENSEERWSPATPGDNERLEFLGDAVLGLVVAEALFKAHPKWREGDLSRVRAQLVSRTHMAEVATDLRLGRFLRLNRGEERSGLRSKGTVLSNTMEAVIGAIFLDGGLEPVKAFVRRSVIAKAAELLAEELRVGAALGNYKSALQEYLQSVHVGTPDYKVKSESGPDHRKKFVVEVRIKPEGAMPGQNLARGRGTTKKHAEQDAARRALDQLGSGAIKIGGPMPEAEEQSAE